ncbi:hypothetical protein TUM19329_29640 [Legionella antarctica]|uniref:Glycosyl transferase family 1 domain-containing protein n=1 Tax=Legionella antarctica TaxID=2708020 RepID=A0A6F8T8Q4_9GAMM|nr:glycosyltransferase family 1 protein [Legionella antarctica]BCA96603.1 hypothetical protein TUM19329_29640 [Legionella antarctica]
MKRATGAIRYKLLNRSTAIFWKIKTPIIIKTNSRRVADFLSDRLNKLGEYVNRDVPISLVHYLVKEMEQKSGRQLFVDISDLIIQDRKTGIQRVVRSVLLHWLKNPPESCKIQPVYATSHGCYKYAHQFVTRFFGCNTLLLNDVPIKCNSGDLFLVLDCNPRLMLIHQKYYQYLQNKGVKIYFLVHDILPALMPDYFPGTVSELFTKWLNVVSFSDGLFCVSRSTTDALTGWLKINVPEHLDKPRIDWFHLGSDIKSSAPTSGVSEEEISFLKRISNQLNFLVVGTIEPRKGLGQTLDAFELLWSQNQPLNLVIIGRYGWMMDSFIQRVLTHPQYNQHLFWIKDASDEYLIKLYETASCLLMPSEAEGFGLPIIEAAHHGLPVIARDTPVFREVTGNFAFFFKGFDAQEMMVSIRRWIICSQQGQIPDPSLVPRLTWEESASNLLSSLILVK